ncbi:hypothetical protein SAMN05660489_06327 [Pseudomonas sp. LAMO17WK12:I10]|nr:hypothetical protein H160_06352 [Pseudomonas sp. LAMO17WK12:I9]SNY53882.1 hypothetical protein SAMN05660489_06327 [Pseudomonas sp. LAMO17WK12:I10]
MNRQPILFLNPRHVQCLLQLGPRKRWKNLPFASLPCTGNPYKMTGLIHGEDPIIFQIKFGMLKTRPKSRNDGTYANATTT